MHATTDKNPLIFEEVVLVEIVVGGGRIRGMKIRLIHKFEDIISLGNLLEAWQEFLPGKRNRKDVQEFHANLLVLEYRTQLTMS